MPDYYRNDTFGFSLIPPRFNPESNASIVTVVSFYAPPEDNFSANLTVQEHSCDLDDFIAVTDAQISDGVVEIVSKKSSKFGGYPAIEYVYKMNIGGNALQFISLGVDVGQRVHLFTCTALETRFNHYEDMFRRALGTLTFDT